VGDDSLTLSLQADMIADVGRAYDSDNGVPGEVDRLSAGLIWFPGAGTGRTHSYQFSLITQAACAVTRRLVPRSAHRTVREQQY
jgi:hypothetical protein